jgi:hypothetical protein
LQFTLPQPQSFNESAFSQPSWAWPLQSSLPGAQATHTPAVVSQVWPELHAVFAQPQLWSVLSFSHPVA